MTDWRRAANGRSGQGNRRVPGGGRVKRKASKGAPAPSGKPPSNVSSGADTGAAARTNRAAAPAKISINFLAREFWLLRQRREDLVEAFLLPRAQRPLLSGLPPCAATWRLPYGAPA